MRVIVEVERGKLVEEALRGNKRAVARLISIVEDNPAEARHLMRLLAPYAGRSHLVGVTGPPGSGKSTLIAAMIKELRQRGKTVGVVAVDPSSPFSGGALLGDRVRMQSLTLDEGVFIRSMATRGERGGVARAASNAARILDATGKDYVFVETAGAGQSDVDIMEIVQTVVLVLPPSLGDEIQALKAGIMEAADIFVVNKADLGGADKVVHEINEILDLIVSKKRRPPVVKVSALKGEGIAELIEKLEEHRRFLASEKGIRLVRPVRDDVLSAVREAFEEKIFNIMKREEFRSIERLVETGELDLKSAAEEILARVLKAEYVSPPPRRRLERGLVQVYTGNGKGKTSAAFGLALRAIGRGLRVCVIQFIKGGFDYGELYSSVYLPNLHLEAYGRGRFVSNPPSEEDYVEAEKALRKARDAVMSGDYDVVILDEVNTALNLKLIRLEDVIRLLAEKAENVEVVLTGRDAPKEVIEAADLVTEMREVKHPYRRGVQARIGIEY
ncbi:MAG: methylmalonyl Co-A mutase-associated GTPase MeaB [Candidatus Jordarchaeales archaeon]|nr:methylmalonyl Co-A mutase-associated GTPase MeaB [Candidatus Jordarchaeia archaeon]